MSAMIGDSQAPLFCLVGKQMASSSSSYLWGWWNPA
jgi:hypothetical protein